MTTDPRIVMLPGLGADGRLFEPQLSMFESASVVEWIVAERGESLSLYAGRVANTMEIDDSAVLVGVSFGGMVAAEIARQRVFRAVVLIGSCTERAAVPGYLRAAGKIVDLVPDVLLANPSIAQFSTSVFGIDDERHRQLFLAMLADADVSFMRWACKAIGKWEAESPMLTPCFQIHGSADHIIPVHDVRADEVVDQGGHLINVTHADQVNAFISRAIKQTEPHDV